MSASTPAIIANKLTKSFENNHVLKGLDLTIPKGSVFALLGPNGAGKTTTVRILATLLKADAGTAVVHGFNVATEADDVRASIGLTGQYASVDDKLTGKANLEVIGRLYHLSKEDAKKRATELLEVFELTDAADRAVKNYSGGMRRRLDLAASLIVQPPILFLDEPTTGLDPHSRITMWGIIKKLVDGGTTILLTTQYLEEADELADTIAVINDGRVIAQGTAEELKAKIGGDRLDVVFATAEDYAKASQMLSSRTIGQRPEMNTLSFPADQGTGVVAEIFQQLATSGVAILSFDTHRPTLDDVFLTLTGHATESSVATTETHNS